MITLLGWNTKCTAKKKKKKFIDAQKVLIDRLDRQASVKERKCPKGAMGEQGSVP